jgi:hypothetical protein
MQVTIAPVLAKAVELALRQMYTHIIHTFGFAIFPVTTSHIIKYPNMFMTTPVDKTNHGEA